MLFLQVVCTLCLPQHHWTQQQNVFWTLIFLKICLYFYIFILFKICFFLHFFLFFLFIVCFASVFHFLLSVFNFLFTVFCFHCLRLVCIFPFNTLTWLFWWFTFFIIIHIPCIFTISCVDPPHNSPLHSSLPSNCLFSVLSLVFWFFASVFHFLFPLFCFPFYVFIVCIIPLFWWFSCVDPLLTIHHSLHPALKNWAFIFSKFLPMNEIFWIFIFTENWFLFSGFPFLCRSVKGEIQSR